MLIKPRTEKSILTFGDAIESGRKWGLVEAFVSKNYYKQTEARDKFFQSFANIDDIEDIEAKASLSLLNA